MTFYHQLIKPTISFPEPAILGIRCRKPGILANIELRIPFQRPIRFLPETDYPRASRSFPRIAGSGNEIVKPIITLGLRPLECNSSCQHIKLIDLETILLSKSAVKWNNAIRKNLRNVFKGVNPSQKAGGGRTPNYM
jgi:hypothetical protein